MTPTATHSQCSICGTHRPQVGGLCVDCVAGGGVLSGLLEPEEDSFDWESVQIPGWQVQGLLGGGGMGMVLQAVHLRDGQEAAIKVLNTRWSAQPAMEARFAAEARRLGQLDHPHILKFFATAETQDGRLCLITELVRGCNLAQLLRVSRLTAERGMHIFRKVAAAVAYAHERGVLHRDLKPSNILIGQDDMVKLADFGLAKEMAPQTPTGVSAGTLTLTTDQFGSAYYMAPERLVDARSATPQGDVYSLGVLLYHLLAGKLPLGSFTPLSELTGLPKKMDHIVSSALEADPARRISSVAELMALVETAWTQHLTKLRRTKKYRTVKISALCLGLLVGAGALGAWWQREKLSEPPMPSFAHPSSATNDHPWQNSLGMGFVPIPGLDCLFGTHEVRRADVVLCIQANLEMVTNSWMDEPEAREVRAARSQRLLDHAGRQILPESWDKPGFAVTPEHAACFIRPSDVWIFCKWLTWKEHYEKRLPPDWHYRIPTETEWLTACGDAQKPLAAGNLAGSEAADESWPDYLPCKAPPDAFPRTAPVGSFPAESHGLYDLAGNVSEWVHRDGHTWQVQNLAANMILMGPSYIDGDPAYFRYDKRRFRQGVQHLARAGMRLVLAKNPSSEKPSAK